MSAPERNGNVQRPNDLTPGLASQLLALGLSGPRRPVDDVIDRLAEPDGASWFGGAISALTGLPQEVLTKGPDGALSAEQLTAIKEKAKSAMADAATKDDACAATALYFVTVAAAIVAHGKTISSQPPQELAAIMSDLAGAAPDPWAEMLMDASMRLG